jgi:hypothetical protein
VNRLSLFSKLRGNRPGMGDAAIPVQEYDRYEKYWDQIRSGATFPGRAPVVDPTPKDVLDEKIARLKKALVCGTYFIKSPNWIEPPITARNIECVTEEFVTVTEGIVPPPNGPIAVTGLLQNFTVLCRLVVPDRFITVLTGFGHEVADPLADWGNIEWTFFLNGDRVPTFESFRQQRGDFVCPCKFPMPLVLKWKDEFAVAARPTDGNDHDVIVRINGYQFPVEVTAGEGAPFNEFHTL